MTIDNIVKAAVDHPASMYTAAAVTVGSLIGLLPAVATILAISWYLIQIWDSPFGLRQRNRLKRLVLRSPPAAGSGTSPGEPPP